MSLSEKEYEFLYARLSDLYKRAESGALAVSPFYSPAELVKVRRWTAQRGCGGSAVIYGGYASAERARVYFLPDYITLDAEDNVSRILSEYGYSDPTLMLKISGSGFRELSHRDYMGSVLSLGIERDVIGDIVTDGKYCAYIFCECGIAPYIKENLKKVANDTVKITECEMPQGEFGTRQVEVIHETVASGRFDAVISAVCNLSRDASKKLVESGMCELNHELASSVSSELCAGDVFSIRGKGKYKLASVDGENRRGRLRITVHKRIN